MIPVHRGLSAYADDPDSAFCTNTPPCTPQRSCPRKALNVKQFLLLCILVSLTVVGSMISPFWPLLFYYGLAVLRPQAIWNWAMPMNIRWSLIAAGLLLMSTLIHSSRIFNKIHITHFLVSLLGYALLLIISTLIAYDTQLAQHWGIEYAKIIAVALLSLFVIDRIWHVQLMSFMVLLSIGYLAFRFNEQYFLEGHRLDIFHIGYGGLDNNGAGLFMAMGIPIAYAFAMGGGGENRRWLQLAAMAAGAFMVHAVMLSYSRGAMLAGSVGMLWLAIRHRPRTQAILGGVLCTALIITLAGPEIRGEFLSTQNYETDRSAQSRFTSWSAAWGIALDHPLFGAGIRNSSLLIQNYGTHMPGRTVHNQYLQIAADSGLPALGCYLVMVGIAVHNLGRSSNRAYTLARNPTTNPELLRDLKLMVPITLGLQGSLITFLVGGVFLSLEVFELPWLLMTLGAVMPQILTNRIQSQEEQHVITTKKKPGTPNNDPWAGQLRLRGA